MVKIQTITHQVEHPVVRTSYAQHPFSRARQFQRAYNAAKLQKIFAKPFITALSGHTDGVSVLAKCPSAINKIISGAHDGEIKVWDISQKRCLISTYEHQNSVKGVSFSRDGTKFVSSSQQSIQLYDFKQMFEDNIKTPITKYLSKLIIGQVDHSWQNRQFATAGQIVQIWSYERTKPIYKLEWNCDSIIKVKYNPAQTNILCGTAIDRSIILYDLRGQSPIQKIFLSNKCSCVSFNPIEPINFTVGCDDSNCYSFDMRKMDKAKTIHKDHVGAITDIDYSPTGQEFVTGSFDRTVRLFKHLDGRSHQVYHAKRMQIVNSVIFSMDSHYIFSGSEDMNVRMWKSNASQPIGIVNQRQQRAIDYREALITKFNHSNKIRRIARYHHLPKYILNARKRRDQQNVSKFRKRINRQANTGIHDQTIPEKQKIVNHIEIKDEEEITIKRNKKRKNKEDKGQQEQLERQQ